MELKEYIKPMTSEERERFAIKCGTTKGHLNNVMYGYKPCGTDLAVAIEAETKKKVTRKELRPDDFWRHWPDLKQAKRAPAAA